MKKRIAASFLLITLSACSSLLQPIPVTTPPLTAVPTRTVTVVMPRTPLAPSETSEAGSEWSGIPIMPGAIDGDGDEESYVYTIQSMLQTVQEFYRLELEKRHWQLLSEEKDSLSTTLVYVNKQADNLSITLFAKDDEVLVLLVK